MLVLTWKGVGVVSAGGRLKVLVDVLFCGACFRPILEKTWDKKKTVHENFKSIGLVLNPNHAVPIPKTRKPKPLWKV